MPICRLTHSLGFVCVFVKLTSFYSASDCHLQLCNCVFVHPSTFANTHRLIFAGHRHRDSGKCHLSPVPGCTALTSWTSIHGCFLFTMLKIISKCWNAGHNIIPASAFLPLVISVGIPASKLLVTASRVSPALPTASAQLCFCCNGLIKHPHSWQLYQRERDVL